MASSARAGFCLVLAFSVYASYQTPAPDMGDDMSGPIRPSSYVMLAPLRDGDRASLEPASRGLFSLSPRDRGRCWVLFRIIVDVFRHAPDRRDSLERVLMAYAVHPTDPPGRGPCTSPAGMPSSRPKGDR